jgi:hypothetical protein
MAMDASLASRIDPAWGPAALGLRAQKGGAIVVALTLADGVPHILQSIRIDTHAPDDRLALEPYHVAREMAPGPDGRASSDAKAAVAEGRGRQQALAAAGLRGVAGRLADAGYPAILGALLVNRAGWIEDLLDYSLGWKEHAAVAEGLAVRDALRAGLRNTGLALIELDETSLPVRAATTLRLTPDEIALRLKTLGTAAGKPWRKEQQHACLAAWIALVERS